MKRRIELSVETERMTLRGPGPAISWCSECKNRSMKITSEQAALLAGVSEMSIYRMVEGRALHHSETKEGGLRICLRSLELMTSFNEKT